MPESSAKTKASCRTLPYPPYGCAPRFASGCFFLRPTIYRLESVARKSALQRCILLRDVRNASAAVYKIRPGKHFQALSQKAPQAPYSYAVRRFEEKKPSNCPSAPQAAHGAAPAPAQGQAANGRTLGCPSGYLEAAALAAGSVRPISCLPVCQTADLPRDQQRLRTNTRRNKSYREYPRETISR
ncbi:hypothetical protein D3C73_1139780 [compost metagenome]